MEKMDQILQFAGRGGVFCVASWCLKCNYSNNRLELTLGFESPSGHRHDIDVDRCIARSLYKMRQTLSFLSLFQNSKIPTVQ